MRNTVLIESIRQARVGRGVAYAVGGLVVAAAAGIAAWFGSASVESEPEPINYEAVRTDYQASE